MLNELSKSCPRNEIAILDPQIKTNKKQPTRLGGGCHCVKAGLTHVQSEQTRRLISMVLPFSNFCSVCLAYHPAKLEVGIDTFDGCALEKEAQASVSRLPRPPRIIPLDSCWITEVGPGFAIFRCSSRPHLFASFMEFVLLDRHTSS